MAIPQHLTDEQAAAIWSGDTASILGFDDDKTTDTEEKTEVTNDSDDTETKTPVTNEDLANVWSEDDTEDDDIDDNTDSKKVVTTDTQVEPKKGGRKPSDLVSMVNQLVKDEVLVGFEGEEEIQTIEEAKELIKENLKYKEESSFEAQWQKKLETYSPQVQAILHYAEKGGKDITPLLNAISEVEEASNVNLDEPAGQEEIVRQVLKLKGFDDEEILDQIDTLKDLDKLKAKAEKFKPELDRMKEERINLLMQEQEARDKQARDAARVYVQTIQYTLDKDVVGEVKLKREDKSKIIGALAEAKYKSIGGFTVNEFVKTLEELQFGKNSNYEHFLNIVHMTVDRDGFINKLKESLKTDVTAETIKKLKTAKQTSPNTTEDRPEVETRKVIKRDGFRNPYA